MKMKIPLTELIKQLEEEEEMREWHEELSMCSLHEDAGDRC